MKSIRKLATAVAVAAALPGAAEAAVVIVNFGGVYSDGQPDEGQSFKGSFAYDDKTPATVEFDFFNDGIIDARRYQNFLTSPFVFTDNKGTSTISPADVFLDLNYGSNNTLYLQGFDSAGQFASLTFSTLDPSFAKDGLPNSFPALSASTNGMAGGGRSSGVLTSISAKAAVAAVPEPATWAIMTVGVGIVGGAMRRRRGKVAVPAVA